jgi:hypothetical protein
MAQNRFPKDAEFGNLPSDSGDTAELALRLLAFGSGSEVFISGTCFPIAGRLLITAKHVVEDFLAIFGAKGNEVGCMLWAVQIISQQYLIWRVSETFLCPHTDLALLTVVPYNDLAAAHETWRVPAIQMRPPSIGEIVGAIGYRASAATLVDGKLEVNDQPTKAFGPVSEVYPEFRDKVRMPFPSFAIDARFDGGMSGGPIINEQGEICGVVLSSFPASETDPKHTSYAASLRPLLRMTINVRIPTDVAPKAWTIDALVQRGFIRALSS